MHLGLILPNFGEGSTPEGIRRTAEAAEELGFDSVRKGGRDAAGALRQAHAARRRRGWHEDEFRFIGYEFGLGSQAGALATS